MEKKKMYKRKKKTRLTIANRKACKELGEEEIAFLIAAEVVRENLKSRYHFQPVPSLVLDGRFQAEYQNIPSILHIRLTA